LTIRKKLFFIIVIHALLMSLIGVIGYLGIKKVNNNATEVFEKITLAKSAQELSVKLQQTLMAPHDYIIHGEKIEGDNFEELWADLETHFNEVYEEINKVGCDKERALIKEIYTVDMPQLKEKATIILEMDNPSDISISGGLMEDMDSIALETTQDINQLVKNTENEAKSALGDAQKTQRFANSAIIFSGFAIFFLSIVLGFTVSQRIGRNIHVLDEGVKGVVLGDLTQRVRVKSKDEFGGLAHSFNQMARKLEKSQGELELWAETLEDKVKERTQELVAVNKQVSNRVKELTAMFNVSRAISSTLDLKILLKRIFNAIVPLIGAQYGAILLVDESSLKRCWIHQEDLGKKHCVNCEKCPACKSDSLECWTISGTLCREEMQGKFGNKITECVKCPVFQSIKLKPVSAFGISLKDLKAKQIGVHESICGEALLELKPKLLESFSENSDFQRIFPEEKISSQIYLPLLTKDKVVGVLALAISKNKRITDKQISLLESIAYQVAIAIENAQLYSKISNEKAKSDAVFSSMGEGVITADKDGKIVAVNIEAGEIFGVNPQDLIGKNFILCHPKNKRGSVRDLVKSFMSGETSIKEMQIPIKGSSKIIRANLAPIRDESDKFMGTVLLLQDITERERLYNATRESAAEFSTLYEVSKVLGSTLELSDLLNFVIDCSVETMRADIGSIMLLNKERNELKIVAGRGLSREIIDGTHLKLGEGIAGWVAKKKESLLLNNVESDSRFKGHEMRKELCSAISVPLKIKEEIIGVINVGTTNPRKFSLDDLRLLSTLAGEAAVSIYNAQLFEQMEELYIETVKAFVEAIEAKDSYTRGHSENVTKYVLLIASELGFSDEEKETLKTAALLHDIGKIGIKEEVLNKPSSLTAEEYDLIKTHPNIAIQIIGKVPKLKDVVPIVFHHHERYDGNGYLKGLKGEEIPLGARVMAVADSFDAMISVRPYREAMSFQQAIKELKKNAGKQFDPHIVKAFLKSLGEIDLGEIFSEDKLKSS